MTIFSSFVFRCSSLALSALALGCTGADGARGPAGLGGPPSVSAVLPASAFLGGSATVTVSGNGTQWGDGTTPEFGPGVTVKSVVVASPTALVADIEVAFDAPVGLRDVTVSGEGGEPLAYRGAFRVLAPTSIVTEGTVAQGSIVVAKVNNLDVLRPYDTTTEGDGLFTPITYPNLTLGTESGVAAQLESAGAYSLGAVLIIDADAPAGPTSLDVLSGPAGARTSFPNPAAIDVAARAPEALTAGAAASVAVDAPYDSKLFAVTPGAGLRIVEASASTSELNANPQLYLLGESGRFADLLSAGASVGIATGASPELKLVYWDNSGSSGYAAALRVSEYPATGGGEAEPNGGAANAKALTLPFVIQKASLASAADEDWFTFTVAAADAGKSAHVRTLPGDPLTDAVVELFESDGVTTVDGPSDDSGYHEDALSSPLAAGTYYVVIRASSYFTPGNGDYDAYVHLE